MEPSTLLNRVTYRRVQSIAVNVAPDANQASAAAYFHTAVIGADSDGRSLYGRYVGRLVKVADAWRFAELRISSDHVRDYPLGEFARAVADASLTTEGG